MRLTSKAFALLGLMSFLVGCVPAASKPPEILDFFSVVDVFAGDGLKKYCTPFFYQGRTVGKQSAVSLTFSSVPAGLELKTEVSLGGYNVCVYEVGPVIPGRYTAQASGTIDGKAVEGDLIIVARP